MKIFKRINELKEHIKAIKAGHKIIGFVPTMGAMHPGHISLIERAKCENDIVVCSIFVNPAQFNNKSDFIKYPRTLEGDIEKLNKVQCDVLFIPSEAEMYPESNNGYDDIGIDLGCLDKVMEGKYRPGHFNGVGIVVKRLFNIVEPHIAYFGQKDYQQLLIIKFLVKTLDLPVKIVGCPTIREKDGLAMSSRNAHLSTEERKNAAIIHQSLKEITEKRYNSSVIEIQKQVKQKIGDTPFLQIEYFEISNSKTLLPIRKWEESKNIVACIAVYAGKVRLIDNIVFKSKA